MRSQHRMPSTDAGLLREPLPQKSRRSCSSLAVADVPIEIGEDVLDEDLAAELLAEEADVAADDGPEIEEHRRLARREGRQELAERLGGENSGSASDAGCRVGGSDSLLRGARRSRRPTKRQ